MAKQVTTVYRVLTLRLGILRLFSSHFPSASAVWYSTVVLRLPLHLYHFLPLLGTRTMLSLCCSSILKGMLDNTKPLLYPLIKLVFLEQYFVLFISKIPLDTFWKHFIASNCMISPVWVYLQVYIRASNTFWHVSLLNYFPSIQFLIVRINVSSVSLSLSSPMSLVVNLSSDHYCMFHS